MNWTEKSSGKRPLVERSSGCDGREQGSETPRGRMAIRPRQPLAVDKASFPSISWGLVQTKHSVSSSRLGITFYRKDSNSLGLEWRPKLTLQGKLEAGPQQPKRRWGSTASRHVLASPSPGRFF